MLTSLSVSIMGQGTESAVQSISTWAEYYITNESFNTLTVIALQAIAVF